MFFVISFDDRNPAIKILKRDGIEKMDEKGSSASTLVPKRDG